MADTMLIRVQSGREALEVRVPATSRVMALKEALAALITSTLPRNMRLIYKGKVLQPDTATLSSFAIADGARVMLILSGSRTLQPLKRPLPTPAAVDERALLQREAAWRATGSVALREAGLQSLPALVIALGCAVRVLDLSGNALLHALPLQLGQLSRLTHLTADRCRIDLIAWDALPLTLVSLSLDGCGLQALSPSAGFCPSLRRLNVARNALSRLPDALGSLAALTSLDASHNALSSLPDSLGGCVALEELRVASNALSSLPASLAACPRLVLLDASDNAPLAAAGVPRALLSDARSLSSLLLHGCAVTALQLREMEGYDALEKRRQAKATQALRSVGATAGFGEGADAEMQRRAG